jgi:hypothetical protein
MLPYVNNLEKYSFYAGSIIFILDSDPLADILYAVSSATATVIFPYVEKSY